MGSKRKAAPRSRSTDTAVPPPQAPPVGVPYAREPLNLRHHFGREGGVDFNMQFNLRKELPIFQDSDEDRVALISNPSTETLRVLISDAKFETGSRKKLAKPDFLFGDRVIISKEIVHGGHYKWLRQIGDRRFFLPDMHRMFPISYYQCASVPRHMNWDLVREQDGVAVGVLTHKGVHTAGYSRQVSALEPCLFSRGYPLGETASPANTFMRRFLAAKGEFPTAVFRTPGWVHSTKAGWWARMIEFVLAELKEPLAQSGLGCSIRATQFGIALSPYNFFAILERYNPETCTFFTPAGELGFALHEMFDVSGLPFGDLPYEEFIPGSSELKILKETNPEVYDTLWEVMCHFQICRQLTGSRGRGIKQLSWAEYLFKNLSDKTANVSRREASTLEAIEALINDAADHYVNEGIEDDFPAQTEFESFHHQAATPISDMALLAGFLMLWLKRCVIPTGPIDAVTIEVVYPAVLLAHGRPINLLSAMTCCLQHGLRELCLEFIQVKEIDSEGKKSLVTPNPRVPLPYTYLMAWYVSHCAHLMSAPSSIDEGFIPFVQRLEKATWIGTYVVKVRQILSRDLSYDVFRCFPDFEGGGYGQVFQDTAGPNDFTRLDGGVFHWLLNIRPGYLILRQNDKCIIEPYQPYRFARQFGYDQLYVGNPRSLLSVMGNIYEGARAWYYSTAGCTGATFRLPHKTPNSLLSAAFCNWYYTASIMTDYKQYTSGLREIRRVYSSRKGARVSRLKGIDEFLDFEDEAEEEEGDLGVESPPVVNPPAAEAPRTKATGKRALSEAEEVQYEKRARRKLQVDPPAEKLMVDAFKSASRGEEQGPIATSHPDRTGPHSEGATFSEEFSPHFPLDQGEGGGEFPIEDMGASSTIDPDISPFPDQTLDAASSPVRVLPTTSSSEGVKLPTDDLVSEELVHPDEGQSPTSSALLPHSETIIPSPTTGQLTKVDTSTSSPGPSAADDDEPLDYGSSSHHDDADEDESDDDDPYTWADQPPPPSDKASGYLPFYPSGSPTHEAAGTSSSLPSQATDVPPSELMPMTTSSLSEEPLSLTIPLKPVGTEIVLSSTQTGALMVLPSSPSQLDVTIASPTSSRSSPTSPASGSMLLDSPLTSPMKSLSPVAVPSVLKILLRPLEDMMKLAIEEISARRASFDSFKPMLMHSLNGIRYLDDARLFQHCSEGVSRLEKDLRALEELHQADLAAQAALVFNNLKAEAARQYETFQEAITDRELELASLQGLCMQKQHAVDDSNAAIQATRAEIDRLRVELARHESELAREEEILVRLRLESVKTYATYRSSIRDLELLQKQASAIESDESVLKKKAEVMVQGAHEEKLAAVKSRLVCFTFTDPEA